MKLNPELEDIYVNLFKPLQVTRFQFRELYGQGHVKDIPMGSSYAIENENLIGQKLSVLVSGR